MADTLQRQNTSENKVKKTISFHYHPYKIESMDHFIEKSVQGKKRFYLKGISSGIKLDQHGERMTEKCIKSFNDQANSGSVLLYPDVHGIRASEDIGQLTKAKLLPDGDWYTEYKLYDASDFDDPDLHKNKLATIDTLKRQITGQKPYLKPIQKGFSVEGYIPDSGIIEMSSDGKRVIDEVALDGVILVPRPAYQDGIANAVFKALDMMPPWVENKVSKSIENNLRSIVKDTHDKRAYFEKKYEIEDALNQLVEDIMKDPKPNKNDRLIMVYNEYRDIMIGLLLNSESIFQEEDDEVEEIKNLPKYSQEKKEKIITVIKSLQDSMDNLKKSVYRKKQRR